MKLKDQPKEEYFLKQAAAMEDAVWLEFDPDENGKMETIAFFSLYRKMVREKKREPD